MNNTHSPIDPYDVVLADLRAQRDRIDSAIAALTALRGGGSAAAKPSNDGAQGASDSISAGALLGMSIADAALKVLTARKRKMTNTEILADLKAGGMVLTSKDPVNVVNSVLNRRFQSAGDIVRVERGTWGLKVWYPGRNFKTKNGDKEVAQDAKSSSASDEPLEEGNVPSEQQAEKDDESELI